MRKACLVLTLLLSISCARTKAPDPLYEAVSASEPPILVQYGYTDIPSEHRIEIAFSNTLREGVCLDVNQWPGWNGLLDESGRGILLFVGHDQFQYDKITSEYCPGCTTYVAPGQTIRTSLPYEAFHLPEALFNENKRMEFFPKAYRCEKRK